MRVRLIHWKAEEAEVRAERVRAAGHEVDARPFGPQYGKEIRKPPPDVYLIDLSRLPSHGREAGAYLRGSKQQGHVPVVFVDGAPDKVARVREELPDAIYCGWRGIRGALKKAARQKLAPRKRAATSGPYSTTPLWKKLGARPGAPIALLGAPDGVDAAFAELPPGTELRRRASTSCSAVVWFVRSRAELQRGLARRRKWASGRAFWVSWPKKSAGIPSDLDRDWIRNRLLAEGLVDIKVCALDQEWSAMRYAERRS